MKKIVSFVILILTLAVQGAVAQTQGRASISPDQLERLLGKRQAAAVNVMSRFECTDHRIPGSFCIPCDQLERELPARVKDRSLPVVFYCDLLPCECNAAGLALKLGYAKASELEGGLAAWKGSGYPTESVRRISRRGVPSISARELSPLLARGAPVLVVDIRSEKDYRAGHIGNAVHIPLDSLENRYAEVPIDRQIIVVDKQGRRGYLAASFLNSKGIDNVRWLSGGMEKWRTLQALKESQKDSHQKESQKDSRMKGGR